ncbi:type II toxin-antitoxin system Phd/YefM family antitoxin [Patescibacteria group bacterium]|nr:type II toxin-antitoxin system Phd/YefM family antitoxin [Patescibacteria group bacterium]
MKSVSATNARRQLFDLIEQAGKPGSFISITHRDLPDVVLMSYEEFEGWQETMEILSDEKLMQDIRDGIKDKESVTLEEMEESFAKKRT